MRKLETPLPRCFIHRGIRPPPHHPHTHLHLTISTTMTDIQPVSAKPATQIEHDETRISEDLKHTEQPVVAGFTGKHADMYAEALEKYGAEGSIPPEAEKRLKRKLDMRLLPLLGIS